jgi:hypothetical protein
MPWLLWCQSAWLYHTGLERNVRWSFTWKFCQIWWSLEVLNALAKQVPWAAFSVKKWRSYRGKERIVSITLSKRELLYKEATSTFSNWKRDLATTPKGAHKNFITQQWFESWMLISSTNTFPILKVNSK